MITKEQHETDTTHSQVFEHFWNMFIFSYLQGQVLFFSSCPGPARASILSHAVCYLPVVNSKCCFFLSSSVLILFSPCPQLLQYSLITRTHLVPRHCSVWTCLLTNHLPACPPGLGSIIRWFSLAQKPLKPLLIPPPENVSSQVSNHPFLPLIL